MTAEERAGLLLFEDKDAHHEISFDMHERTEFFVKWVPLVAAIRAAEIEARNKALEDVEAIVAKAAEGRKRDVQDWQGIQQPPHTAADAFEYAKDEAEEILAAIRSLKTETPA